LRKESKVSEVMTLYEVADYLRVTKKTIYRLLSRGSIPAAKVSHQWRFSRDSIDEWLQQNSVGATADKDNQARATGNHHNRLSR
jgi:excisionase family DNA binding protein